MSSIKCFLPNDNNRLATSLSLILIILLGIDDFKDLSSLRYDWISVKTYLRNLTVFVTLLIYSFNIAFWGALNFEYFSLNLSTTNLLAKIRTSLCSEVNEGALAVFFGADCTCSTNANLHETYSFGSSASAYSNNLYVEACNL